MSKFNQVLSVVGLTALVALVPAAAAQAATITLVTTAFASPTAVEDFEDATINPEFSFTATSGTALVLASGYTNGVTSSGVQGLSTNNFPDPIHITFTNPVFAAGMFFGNDDICCSNGYSAFLDVYSVSNVLLGSVSVVANMNDFADQFIGFTSDTLVGSAVIRYGNGSNVGLYTYIDDVQTADAVNAVPEPTSLVLLGGGLSMVARRLRRSRS